ncbi:putative uncharacterized protein DDB_G0271982 [Sabethes cyaneus]|uniref:putative uncharacterized protein DDB_G0271982 n=1 Tax=Sabethes cyaneus TaxID=53552 RepID=UPI00237E6FF0|nr:putative uncharacterized protein DDB_G0271982 [Sabethes cyaneus]
MSYQQLTDETFPASLSMDFEILEDEISISPPRILEPDKTNGAAAPSSVAASHLSGSNTSSGNYSFSTENENGSSSSGSSNPPSKFHPTTSKQVITAKDTKKVSSNTLAKPVTGQKKAKSLENLLNNVPPQTSSLKRQKYGHIKSKVKQYIDETTKKRDRQPLLRHKSMPETCIECPAEKNDEIDLETNTDNLKTMLREKTEELDSLKRHLNFCEMQREDNVFTIEALKRKIESMRLEHSKRENERQREREVEKEREKLAIMNTYLRYSNPSLNRIFATVSTQTSPVHVTFNISTFQSDDSIHDLLAESFTATPPTSDRRSTKIIRTSQLSTEPDAEDRPAESSEQEKISPDSATHPEGSPDYLQLLPLSEFSGGTMNTEDTDTAISQDHAEVCQECMARKQNKRKKKSKKIRLASFFCIKKVKD